jgi:hypothetical protein
LAILPLEDLPLELFLQMFLEAFMGKHTDILKVTVQAWTFTCLPLGALMKMPYLETL